MLVLTRKKNQSIVIDGQIMIEVISMKGNSIRLGITAPDEVKILRGELAPFGKELICGNENVSFERDEDEENRPGFVAEISPPFNVGSVVSL